MLLFSLPKCTVMPFKNTNLYSIIFIEHILSICNNLQSQKHRASHGCWGFLQSVMVMVAKFSWSETENRPKKEKRKRKKHTLRSSPFSICLNMRCTQPLSPLCPYHLFSSPKPTIAYTERTRQLQLGLTSDARCSPKLKEIFLMVVKQALQWLTWRAGLHHLKCKDKNKKSTPHTHNHT